MLVGLSGEGLMNKESFINNYFLGLESNYIPIGTVVISTVPAGFLALSTCLNPCRTSDWSSMN